MRGINSRLDEIQAAILEIKLKFLEKENEKRRILAKRYKQELRNLPITFQEISPVAKSAYHLFVIRTEMRNRMMKFLTKEKILTDIYYPYPIHSQPAFKKYSNGKFPVTEKLTQQLLALPLYPTLSYEEQSKIIESIRKFFKT